MAYCHSPPASEVLAGQNTSSIGVYAVNMKESKYRWRMLENGIGQLIYVTRIPAFTPKDVPAVCVSNSGRPPPNYKEEARTSLTALSGSLSYLKAMSTAYASGDSALLLDDDASSLLLPYYDEESLHKLIAMAEEAFRGWSTFHWSDSTSSSVQI
eukprot:GHVU01081298.1.p1 GENE.GHVU01081298.1~~GHVU01081298.1.p1  ORF type:complete len:155 (-),score=12.72 GHVU01081298.1:463-927(-)